MEYKSYAILVSNAAVLVGHKGKRILIDGLYKDLGENFSQIPDWAWKQMKAGKGELANVDYLLFSHSHYDHYYAPYFDAYMEQNEVKGLLLPPLDDTNGLERHWKEYQDKLIVLHENKAQLEDGIGLEIFITRHIDKQFHHIPNQCICLDIEGTRLAFLSDVDYYEEDFLKATRFKADIAFVTPIFYNSAKGRKILNEIMQVKQTIIYHLPSLEDDRFMYFKMAQRDVEKHATNPEEVLIWNETGQSIAL